MHGHRRGIGKVPVAITTGGGEHVCKRSHVGSQRIGVDLQPLDEREHLQQREALAVRRHHAHVEVSVAADQRGNAVGGVRRQVLCGHGGAGRSQAGRVTLAERSLRRGFRVRRRRAAPGRRRAQAVAGVRIVREADGRRRTRRGCRRRSAAGWRCAPALGRATEIRPRRRTPARSPRRTPRSTVAARPHRAVPTSRSPRLGR